MGMKGSPTINDAQMTDIWHHRCLMDLWLQYLHIRAFPDMGLILMTSGISIYGHEGESYIHWCLDLHTVCCLATYTYMEMTDVWHHRCLMLYGFITTICPYIIWAFPDMGSHIIWHLNQFFPSPNEMSVVSRIKIHNRTLLIGSVH